ncbi:urease accessory protein UreH domain-containing protein [Nonomuraea candida]|uniref:urease accessory protein UreH domain-containing protein n=1 Tax=Nonomuraea candida TaxID=359159 RepID=UPI000693A3B8|nr:sulfite exporter TauE/SafE family protein [Nonomuraea candida]
MHPLSTDALTLLAGGLAAGLVAGTATCTAAQGGLLMGLADGRPGRDPAVLGWFLAGRLASYTAMGALLGLLGSVVSLPPQARAVLLVVAGVTVVGFAIRLMRHQGCAAPPPRAPSRYRAPLLGAATVLVPCGVTLGVQLIAVSSGSPLAGAAAMAGFVAGTAPAFALLGYVLRRVSRTRLARLAGVVAVGAGLWTAAAGVNLGGWISAPAPAAAGPGALSVTVWATREGYRPAMVTARAGVPVEVVFKRADQGCTGTVAIAGRDVALPATVRLPPQPPGLLRYACGMGMYAGFINFS